MCERLQQKKLRFFLPMTVTQRDSIVLNTVLVIGSILLPILFTQPSRSQSLFECASAIRTVDAICTNRAPF